MNLSKLHFHSIGRVAANKPLDSKMVEVWSTETSSMTDGEITDALSTVEASGMDADGNKFTVKVDTTNSVPAKWLPFGQSNRITAPDVRRGDRVMIWQFADGGEYWWTDMDDGIKLRRLETVIFAISGTPKEDTDPTSENTYFMEFSSHKKAVTFHTSNANGEPFTWDFQVNAGEGNAVLKNSAGDYISIDGVEKRIEMVNSIGSYIDINKTKIAIFAEDEISLNSKNIILNGKDTIHTETKTMTTENTTWDIKSKTTHTGDFNEIGMLGLSGNMTTTGGGGGTGKVTIGADVVITETVTAKSGANFGGTVTAKKIVSEEAISAPNV